MKTVSLNPGQSPELSFSIKTDHLTAFSKISETFDFVEVIGDNWLSPGPHHQKLEKIRESCDVLMHFVGMNIGSSSKLDKNYLNKIKGLISKYEPLHVSDHLAVQQIEGIYSHDLLPLPFNESTLRDVISKVNMTKDFLNLDVPLLLENLSYYVTYERSTMTEAEFLTALTGAADTYILLDLNNLFVNEHNLGQASSDFLDSIPLDRVKEIHIAGPEKCEDLFVDTHATLPTKKVISDLSQVIKRTGPMPVIYEKDGGEVAFENIMDDLDYIYSEISCLNRD